MDATKPNRIRIELPVPKDVELKVLEKEKRAAVFVAKHGSVEVSVYKCGDKNYYIAWYDKGKRQQCRRADFAKAKDLARAKAKAIADGEMDLPLFSQSDQASLQRIREVLLPTGIPPELAAAQFAEDEAERMAAGLTRGQVHELIRGAAIKTKFTPKQVKDVVTELIIARERDGAFKDTIDDYKSRLGRFARDFQCLLMAITGKEVNDWLRGLKATRKGPGGKIIETGKFVSKRTRNNYRDAIRELYRFAKESNYLPEEWAVFAKVTRVKNEAVVVRIFTPEEGAKLLSCAPDNLVPYLAISFFATMRAAELAPPEATLARLDWRQINFETNEIHVLANVARKIGTDRIIPIQPNLREWLWRYRKPNGPVCDIANVANDLADLAKRAEIEWISNGPRKSSISYRLSVIKNIEQTAHEGGTSPERIRKNYKKTIPESEGKRWYAIFPEAANITKLEEKTEASAREESKWPIVKLAANK